MRSTRSRSLSVLAAGLASVLLLACSAGGGSISSSAGESGSENIGAADGVFFVLDRADLTAHAALIELGDLPGVGWTVTSRDDPGSDDGAAYDLLAEAEPSCAQLVRMSGQAGGILNIGGGINGEPVAWSQIVFERVSADQTSTSTSIEVGIEIGETVAEIQSEWAAVKELFEADSTEECLVKVFTSAFAESGVALTMSATDSSTATPQDGASMAYLMTFTVSDDVVVDMVLEMHVWPYANAAVSVSFMSAEGDLSAAMVGDLLAAVDQKIIAAEQAQ